jgi:hypothetical protein
MASILCLVCLLRYITELNSSYVRVTMDSKKGYHYDGKGVTYLKLLLRFIVTSCGVVGNVHKSSDALFGFDSYPHERKNKGITKRTSRNMRAMGQAASQGYQKS